MYADKRDQPSSPDENLGRWILGGVILLAVAAGAWYWQKRAADQAEAPAPLPAASAPAIKNPIVTSDDVDPSLSATEQVATLIGTPRFEALLVPDDFVRKVVATVDSLTREDVASLYFMWL